MLVAVWTQEARTLLLLMALLKDRSPPKSHQLARLTADTSSCTEKKPGAFARKTVPHLSTEGQQQMARFTWTFSYLFKVSGYARGRHLCRDNSRIVGGVYFVFKILKLDVRAL